LHPDVAIARLAARQKALVTRPQLVTLGLSRRAIEWRLRHGRLHPLYRGVYLVGQPVPPPLARELGAVLACGDRALLSHRAATALWELPCARASEVDVTVPGRARANRRGIRTHRCELIHPRDATKRHGIAVTTPARTLLDLAEVAGGRELERAFDEALVLRVTSRSAIAVTLARAEGRSGAGRLAALLAREAGPARTKRESEELMLSIIRAADLPPPEVNAKVGPHEVDFLWRAYGVIVEIDGYDTHRTRPKMEADYLRDAYLQARGFIVMRVTWRQMNSGRDALIARLAGALARGSSAAPSGSRRSA
jgi:very-short-patch-repair endonuclease